MMNSPVNQLLQKMQQLERSKNDSQTNGLILAYDQKRRFVLSLEPAPEILKAMGRDYKGYFEVERDNGGIKIISRVADQNW